MQLFIRKIYEGMTEESLQGIFAEHGCTRVKILKFPPDHTVGYALFTSESEYTQAFDALNKKKLGEDGKQELLLARPIYATPSRKTRKPKSNNSAAVPKKRAAAAAAATVAETPAGEAAEEVTPAKESVITISFSDTVCISNLPEIVSDGSALEQIFEGFKIVEHHFEGNSAIVKLEDAEQAKKAIETLTGAIVEGMEISIKLHTATRTITEKKKAKKQQKNSKNNDKKAEKKSAKKKKAEAQKPGVVFDFPAIVRNLPYSLTDEEELKKGLAKFDLVGVDIKLRSKKHSKGFAIVGFKSESDREAAEAAAKDIEIGGRKIVIAKIYRRAKDEAAAEKGAEENGAKVVKRKKVEREVSDFVGIIHNLPLDVVEEDSIRQILGDIAYKFAYVKMRGSKSMGYAVVGFNNKEDLDAAITTVSDTSVNGNIITVTLPKRKRQQRNL